VAPRRDSSEAHIVEKLREPPAIGRSDKQVDIITLLI
jgi:hypothetical protein